MCLGHVGHVNPPVQVLVGLDVRVSVGAPYLVVVITLGKEPRGPQDDDGQAMLDMDKLTQVLGGRLRDAVDVPRPRHHILSEPRGGLACCRGQRAAERAGRARKHETADAGRDSLLQQRERAGYVGVHELLLAVGADVRLVQCRGMHYGSGARHAFAHDSPVRNRSSHRRVGRSPDVDPGHVITAIAQYPD